MASCPTSVVTDASLARTLAYLNYFTGMIIDWNRYSRQLIFVRFICINMFTNVEKNKGNAFCFLLDCHWYWCVRKGKDLSAFHYVVYWRQQWLIITNDIYKRHIFYTIVSNGSPLPVIYLFMVMFSFTSTFAEQMEFYH